MQISIVVAASENNVIGVDNQLPWHLPDDLKFFKKATLGKPVIMGKNTWRSIGRALPGRLNIVLSTSLKEVPEGVMIFEDFEAAMHYLQEERVEEACIIGGGSIYSQTLQHADIVWLTRVHTQIENGTAFFPLLSPGEWQREWAEEHQADEKHNFSFTFEKWVRI